MLGEIWWHFMEERAFRLSPIRIYDQEEQN